MLAIPAGGLDLTLAATPAAAAGAAAEPTLPPLVLSGPGNLVTRVQDTYVTTADAGDHSKGAFLHIGIDKNQKKYRSLLQFDVSKLRGAAIESASLRVYNSYTGSCAGWWMYADPIADSWNQSTVNWANQPAVRTGMGVPAIFGIGNAEQGCQDHPDPIDPAASDGIFRLDVTEIVRAWTSGAMTNNGIRLSAGESDTKAYKDFCSMNPASNAGPCAIPYDIPTLEIKIKPGPPVLVATNGDTNRVEFYDGSNPEQWRSTGPYLWWAPDAYHSITDTDLVPAKPGFGGGVDVKIRPAGRYGSGQVMVVADNDSGFVGVIPYPALAGRKWAVNVGGTGVANVHSAELMPDGNVAVALPRANRIQVWSAASGQNWTPGVKPVTDLELDGAHHVLYDPEGPWLWALGAKELVRYNYTADTGTLTERTAFPLPFQTTVRPDAPAYGHVITPVRGNPDRLWVTANAGITQFSKSGADCAVKPTNSGWPDPADVKNGVGKHWCGDFPGVERINFHRMAKAVDEEPVSGKVTYTWGSLPGENNDKAINFVSGSTEVDASAAPSSIYYSMHWLVPAYN